MYRALIAAGWSISRGHGDAELPAHNADPPCELPPALQRSDPASLSDPRRCAHSDPRREPRLAGREIRSLVQRLLDEGVPADDITVLVMAVDTATQACRAALPPLAGSLVWGWGHRTGAFCVESVGRYKGLDAAVIVLWLAAEFDAKIHREWVYAGLSRAKSCLYVVGTAAMCKDDL